MVRRSAEESLKDLRDESVEAIYVAPSYADKNFGRAKVEFVQLMDEMHSLIAQEASLTVARVQKVEVPIPCPLPAS